MNTFGSLFRITSFGESHGKAIGCIIDGCPPKIELSEKDIQEQLDKRRPGQSRITSPRKENDQCEILSGIFEGRTTGTPLTVLVRNKDVQSKDYEALRTIFRPSHADFAYQQKYGIRDHRGGGRSSGRETIARVIGGAIAQKILSSTKTKILGFARGIGNDFFEHVDESFIEKNPLKMADKTLFASILQKVQEVASHQDSLGGIVEIRVKNPPVGLGTPVFGKLEAELARACMSIGSVKGFEMGEGFALSQKKGSESNDEYMSLGKTKRNANGGILGGISTGEDIWFRVAVKPTSSIAKEQQSINTSGEKVSLEIQGRHDPIIIPRVIPVLEAMTALVLVDQYLLQKAQCGSGHFGK
jgi:chorismate synthase